MTGVEITGADHGFWDALTGYNWASWGTILVAILVLLATGAVMLSVSILREEKGSKKSGDGSWIPVVALLGSGAALLSFAAMPMHFSYFAELDREAVSTVESEYGITFSGGEGSVSVMDRLNPSWPVMEEVSFHDESFSLYEGYLVRTGPTTVALAVESDATGTELVEWESGLALESGLEEVESN